MASISIIIPTYNEAQNIVPLVKKIDTSLKSKINWEIIFVDDNSPDQTYEVIKSLKKKYPNIRSIKRVYDRGLAGAVLTGLNSCNSDKIIVMDADLQHDPIFILKLLCEMDKSKSNIVVASRFYKNSNNFNFHIIREIGSKVVIKLFNLFSSIKLSDPMSGFFIIKRDLFLKISKNLSTDGYKILADIILNMPKNVLVSQIPINFKERNAGESKMNLKVLWDFFLVVLHSFLKKYIPREYLSYICVGMIGLLFHILSLYLLYKIIGIEFLISHILATLIAIFINYTLNNFLTFYNNHLIGMKWLIGLFNYNIFCSYGIFISFAIAKTLIGYNFNWLFAGLIGAFTASIWNFTMSKSIVWNKKEIN